jgi:hypothetical protein
MKRFDDTEDPRRRVLVQALTAWIAALGLPPGLAQAASALGEAPTLLQNKSIYRLVGSVKINGIEASTETRILAGDTIETGKGGEIIFVIGGTSMILRESSRLTLDAARKETPNTLLTGLRLLTGKLLSVHGRGRPVAMQTITATIGIRGTGVYMESDPEQSYICTCYGVTDIQSINDPSSKETVSATHHDRPLYILAKAPSGNSIRRAPFINHTDQELMLIETLVGRTPPFVFPGNQYNAPRREY